MSKVAILVMCGLPGSGKTTLSKLLCQVVTSNVNKEKNISKNKVVMDELGKFNDYNVDCFHVCYDLLIPRDMVIRSNKDLGMTEKETHWKLYRQQVVRCVKAMLSIILGQQNVLEIDDFSKEVVQNFCQQVFPVCEEKSFSPDKKVLIIVDDNMFYSSMRYEYFQLSRELRIGFLQVFVDCPVEIALHQNLQRKELEQVPNTIIEDMSQKFEIPCSNHWEVNTLTVMNNKLTCLTTLDRILKLVQKAWDEPVNSVLQVDPSVTCESRAIGSKNFLHQCDQILRQLVSQHMKTIQTTVSKNDMKEKATTLSKIKAEIINEIESGDNPIDVDKESVAGSSKDPTSGLYVQIETLFKQKIRTI